MSSLERTRELPMFFAAVTARYTLQLSTMNANVPLCGADQFLLREWRSRRDGTFLNRFDNKGASGRAGAAGDICTRSDY